MSFDLWFDDWSPNVLTGWVNRRLQLGQFCAFGDGADCGKQAHHEHAAKSPLVVNRHSDLGEEVQRAKAVEQVCDYVANCRNVSNNTDRVRLL